MISWLAHLIHQTIDPFFYTSTEINEHILMNYSQSAMNVFRIENKHLSDDITKDIINKYTYLVNWEIENHQILKESPQKMLIHVDEAFNEMLYNNFTAKGIKVFHPGVQINDSNLVGYPATLQIRMGFALVTLGVIGLFKISGFLT